jgi:glyoxylase-like metal-dependent hydrolase (beta-lactamase superfamily II)
VGNPIDLMHLGHDRVIAAYELDGVVVDPGPATCLDVLLEGLGAEPRALLLTHVHLDHAGATGVLVRRFPRLRVYVHEIGAPHLVEPGRLLASARRLYGAEMDRMWGEVAPVPAGNVVALGGGEVVEGFEVAYAPGHASHHVAYLHADTGDAYVGDVAGVRIPPGELTVMPTPPPDIDIEAWRRSFGVVRAWRPSALCLTHFGRVDAVGEQLDRADEALRKAGERARGGDRAAFLDALDAELEHADPAVAERFRHAAPPDQLWLGLERYWRKRAETAPMESS